ncbi:HAD family hydrolase [Sphingobacterium sp. ML3W]|uniref:HAD family hydrolase n=1 Tax=Sphingobacterium sp. ML3W TaxID=1538644 RepID=UPI00068DF079|nr:HAD family hydrolase [Sphingobacterium sp. ML3W]
MEINQVDSILFDLDGTLWNAAVLYAKAWTVALQQHGIDTIIDEEDIAGLIGLEQSFVIRSLIPAFYLNKASIIVAAVEVETERLIQTEGAPLYKRVKEGLEELHQRYPLFIVSNCDKNVVKLFLKYHGLELLFVDHRTHGENHKSKFENIEDLIVKYNLKKSVYVGDTLSDQKQSELAKIPFVHVNYGFGRLENYMPSFSDFERLTAYFLQECYQSSK